MKKMHLSSPFRFITIFLILFVFSQNTAFAQFQTENNTQNGDFKSKLFFGGGFGLQFGTVTLIELSPLVGYKITPNFTVGLSPTYKYYKYKNYYNDYDLKTNVYGGSIFTRYYIIESLFAHVEYEKLFFNTKEPGYQTTLTQYDSFLVGGGYSQNLGVNSALYLMILWNLNDTPDSPYSNPIFRMGFNIGL